MFWDFGKNHKDLCICLGSCSLIPLPKFSDEPPYTSSYISFWFPVPIKVSAQPSAGPALVACFPSAGLKFCRLEVDVLGF